MSAEVEVATLRRDWNLIDRAEPCEPDGALDALLTLWEDSQQHLTGVAFGVVYVGGKLVRLFDRKAELASALAEVIE